MKSLDPGDVVVATIQGAQETKPRPAVVLSNDDYHRSTGDVILGILTGNVARPEGATDHRLHDWGQAGLSRPSVFRAFLVTRPISETSRSIGHLSQADWDAVSARVRAALTAVLQTGDEDMPYRP